MNILTAEETKKMTNHESIAMTILESINREIKIKASSGGDWITYTNNNWGDEIKNKIIKKLEELGYEVQKKDYYSIDVRWS